VAHGATGPTEQAVPSGAELTEPGKIKNADEEGAVEVASKVGHAASGVRAAELEALGGGAPPSGSTLAETRAAAHGPPRQNWWTPQGQGQRMNKQGYPGQQ
jgi:hypothetical protein